MISILGFPIAMFDDQRVEVFIKHAAFIDLCGVQAVVWKCLAFATMLLVPYMACHVFR